MEKTPLQTLRADFEAMQKDAYRTITVDAVIALIDQIQPTEKQFAEKMWNYGAGYNENSGGPADDFFPDFPTYWRDNFETEELPNT